MARRKNAEAADAVPAVGSELATVGKGVVRAVGSYALGKALPYTPPWVAAAVLPPTAGFAVNQLWGDAAMSAGFASAGIALGGAALSAVVWKTGDGTTKVRRFRRVQATATVAASMGWLTCAVTAGPFGTPMLDIWLLGGALLAASWNARQIMGHGAGAEAEETNGGTMGKLAEAIGWEKVTVKSAKGTGKGTVKAQIEVAPSATIAAVQSTAGKVAAALQVPPSGVVVTPDPEDASRGTVSIRVADLLKDGVAFLMPDAFGLMPTEPIPLGMYADGELWAINPFAAAILQHVLVMGVTGAGKSELLRTLLAHLATRRKMSVFLVDLAKGRQTVGHMADGIDWLIQDAREAKRMLKSLPAAIRARGDVLAAEGLDQWTPESSLNALLVWVEEAADVVDFAELDEIARKARSVGMWLGISLQRATHNNISTDVRANLQGAICMGVNDPGDAGFCLPDSVTDTGAVPAWGSDRPGYGYATGMGIPQDRWTMEARSCLTDRTVLAALVAAAAPYRDPLDAATAAALGQTYAQRAHQGTNRLTPGIEQAAAAAAEALQAAIAAAPAGSVAVPAAPAPVPPAPRPVPLPAQAVPAAASAVPADPFEDDDMDDIEETEAMQIEEIYEEVLGAIPGDPEPDAPYAGLGLDDDVPDIDEDGAMSFEPQERMSTEDARHTLYAELDMWVSQGRLEFSPADLIPATVATGRQRPWLQGELKRLVESGVLQRDGHGVYVILHSPLQPA
ncbi:MULTISPECIES: FtsK/SpoIIIE domain-containing protein [Streptomyces]|uniref:FtsK/SpoIIIE domain-containing protein n=2 Tax=Streptomyces TaxID=1883 RepID=A0ABU4KDM5_9ACTN|nr:FtsK/SpoIIIE domain-containing protein [Streptomyces roseolus]MDX2295874.1 FtsK/SpoIIIE domain-containing protein [Streptomyces roseolus]